MKIVQDKNIDKEITDAIQHEQDLPKKINLVALNHYLSLQKNEDQELEQKMRDLAIKYQKEATVLIKEVVSFIQPAGVVLETPCLCRRVLLRYRDAVFIECRSFYLLFLVCGCVCAARGSAWDHSFSCAS